MIINKKNIKDLKETDRELWEERAAIIEYDGGMISEKAEIEAYKCIANQYDISKEAK